jgi:hypothetical protein
VVVQKTLKTVYIEFYEDFMAVADRLAIGRARKIIKQVEEAVSAWPDFAEKAGLQQAVSAEILAQLRDRPV